MIVPDMDHSEELRQHWPRILTHGEAHCATKYRITAEALKPHP